MGDFSASERDEKRAVAASNLRIDAATAEVLAALEAAAIDALLLKGATIARWLYDGTRGYTDFDLWIRPGQVQAAERVVAALGFEKRVDDAGLPDWWQEHASDWARSQDSVRVDVHETLPGLGVDSHVAWQTLWAESQLFEVAGYRAHALSIPARAMHIALHAAHHGEVSKKVLADLERALDQLEAPGWDRAAALAGELQAVDAFAAGLRLLPEGGALAERLRLPANQSVKVALHAGTTVPPVALGFEQIAQADGLWAKARIVARKVVPPPGFMRHWYPAAAGSRRQLVFAYVWRRPVWLLRRAPGGFRAWREARRKVRTGQD